MKPKNQPVKLVTRATEALRAFLGQVSAIKHMRLTLKSSASGAKPDILVDIEVFGHPHKLACAVRPDGSPGEIEEVITHLHNVVAGRLEPTAFLLIAPSLSQRMQEACKLSNVGYLDFEGNARLVLDEVFIGKRTLPPRTRDSLPQVKV